VLDLKCIDASDKLYVCQCFCSTLYLVFATLECMSLDKGKIVASTVE
jgi:hypothetical protein